MKNNLPKISIIMPVYNAEKTVEKALKSIRKQSFVDFEVLIINDGSTDHTKNVLERFIQNDTRFKLYNRKNEGVGAARQYGLEKTSGNYIIHHDSDDYMPYNALSNLYKTANKNSSATIIIGGYEEHNKGSTKLVKPKKYKKWEELAQAILNGDVHSGLWNKLIPSHLYKGINFEDRIDFMEDVLILIKILLIKHPKIEYVDDYVYNYVRTDDSLTGSYSEKKLKDYRYVIQKIEQISENSNLNMDFKRTKFYYKYKGLIHNVSFDFKNDFQEVNQQIWEIPKVKVLHKFVVWSKLKGICFLTELLLKIRKIKSIWLLK